MDPKKSTRTKSGSHLLDPKFQSSIYHTSNDQFFYNLVCRVVTSDCLYVNAHLTESFLTEILFLVIFPIIYVDC